MKRSMAMVLAGLVSTTSPAAFAAELIMFEEVGCGWCRLWLMEVEPGYGKSREGSLAPLRRLPLSKAQTSGIALNSPVTGTPTFVLVDASREIGRISGYPGAEFFYPMLEDLLQRLPPAANATTSGTQH